MVLHVRVSELDRASELDHARPKCLPISIFTESWIAQIASALTDMQSLTSCSIASVLFFLPSCLGTNFALLAFLFWLCCGFSFSTWYLDLLQFLRCFFNK